MGGKPMLRIFISLVVAWTLSVGSADAAEWNRLISPAELSALIRTDEITVIDIRAPENYAAGHVATALIAPYGSWRGPKDNPGKHLSNEQLTTRLQSLGIEPDARVVVTYQGKDTTDFGAAARVYWTLKSAGLTEIAILNGGINSWISAGQELSTEPGVAAPSSARFALSDEWLITRDGVQDVLTGTRRSTMIDARPALFWEGNKKHPAANRAGTLAGALNITHDSWFASSSTELTAADRVLEIAKGAGYIDDGKELVSFCNTGHWAATNWFAMSELARIEGVKLYPESMVGWSNSGGAMINQQ
jgi:thiosulfate/3-mercaptopyruvate sulfurtransferase